MLARQLYRWGLLAASLAVLLPEASSLAPSGWSASLVLALWLWASLVMLAEVSPVSLPWPDARLTLTPVFEFGALLSFGTFPAAVLVGVGRAAAALLRRNGPWEAARSAAQGMLVIGVSGAVYVEQGGGFGPGLLGGPLSLAALAVTAATFALVQAGLVVWKDAVDQRHTVLSVLQGRVQRQVLQCLLVLPLGLVFAWIEAMAGPVAAAYALIPILVIRGFDRRPVRANATDESHLATVRVLMSAIDAFDPFTRGHSYRISKYAMRIARHLGVPEQELEQIEYGALLHDIGRTAIQLDILLRPRPLEAHERAVLQTHPTVGYEIVKSLPFLRAAAEIVYTHHEQPDGHGYPRGLKGEQIPMGARIIMVAAAFDAMTQERPYRRGLPAEVAYEELRRHSGTQFFPDVVDAFIGLHQRGELDRELDEQHQLLFSEAQQGAATERMAA